ncbi:MAG: hypothetical protein RMI63_02710 [Caldimicrobium sp.]|nr:hypothetical protein [Caldimicrobium sp.]MDW8093918.1 hypothetical protein [Caldimicrobium sp.]
MNLLEESLSLPEAYKSLLKIIAYRREDLIKISLAPVAERFLYFLSIEQRLFLNELFLQLLSKLSYAVYLKSAILLNNSLEREEYEEDEKPRERIFSLYEKLPLGRILDERVFLPKLEGSKELNTFSNRGDLTKLISAFLNYLERRVRENPQAIELHQPSIEEYINRLKDLLYKRRITTWSAILLNFQVKNLQELIWFFLAVLYLAFEGVCGVYQVDGEDFQVFLKS